LAAQPQVRERLISVFFFLKNIGLPGHKPASGMDHPLQAIKLLSIIMKLSYVKRISAKLQIQNIDKLFINHRKNQYNEPQL
jgi:hypothetical protein